MITLDEKLKWPIGTRVRYRGEWGWIDLVTDGVVERVGWPEPHVYCVTTRLLNSYRMADWIPLSQLELASDWEECVRWEVRGEGCDTSWSIVTYDFKESLKDALKYFRKKHPGRTFHGVRITTRRRKR